jgi:hypothetical protein
MLDDLRKVLGRSIHDWNLEIVDFDENVVDTQTT